MSALILKKLSPELIGDYLNFFVHITFSENPHWGKCYCHSFHFTGSDEQWTRDNNRAAVIENIQAGKMSGYLAYLDEKPIAWVNVNNRNNYQSLTRFLIEVDATENIASIVCFVVHPDYRNKGVATSLLKRIVEDCTGIFDFLEAYPQREESKCEANYKGPLSLYLKNGFERKESVGEVEVMRLKCN